ncbi:AAA family ATPase [Pseudomonas moraviensis]|uniref:AAA family ATPase n=1 Tax=Pseudomonas moraviensis TaxID=321662 RepID=UPI002092CC5B|nr:AAA family ATPase [Pseudomonas moraviensis]UST62362.1 AAA family ATPase [Pseudomonas moraviensis]
MEIQSFKLSNVGHFGDLDIEFAPTRTHSSNITVLVGNNGTGKTTVLKSVNTCLTWLIARIRSDKGKGRQLADEEIRNNAPAAVVSIGLADRSHPRAAVCNADDENHLFVWGSARTRGEPAVSDRGFLRDVRELADHYRTRLTADASASLPLIAYYPAERCVNDISLKPSGRQAFDQLDAYDSSFSDGADFRGFFAWFREREDSENEDGLSASALAAISERFGTDSDVWKELATIKASARDSQLTAVRSAIAAFMPEFTNLRVQRRPRLFMTIDRQGTSLDVSRLSQGEKSMIALAGDIARRLALLNPSLADPLQGDGIVLIDDVDLHLDQRRQLGLIEQLSATFPNCQFVLTTRSPMIIERAQGALVYMLDDQ